MRRQGCQWSDPLSPVSGRRREVFSRTLLIMLRKTPDASDDWSTSLRILLLPRQAVGLVAPQTIIRRPLPSAPLT